MASFELRSSNDGHIRGLSKAIFMASKASREALLEFKYDRMRLCARTDLFLVKFVFNKDYFSEYHCAKKHRCFVNLKSLSMPFRSALINSDKDEKTEIKIRCVVEDEMNNQIVFTISTEPPGSRLTYKLIINDIDPEQRRLLNCFNRTIPYTRVEISPKQSKKEKFLLSAFSTFAPDIDQVTIKTSQSEVRFIGSSSKQSIADNTTSEFTHKREDFSTYDVKEDVTATVPLRHLKLFLTFVETIRIHTLPKYIFEGVGLPAHFIYDSQLFKGHLVLQTAIEYVASALDDERILPIELGPNESFIADENIIQPEDDYEIDEKTFGHYDNTTFQEDEDDIDDIEDGYHNNQSQSSAFLDGNLEGLNTASGRDAASISESRSNYNNNNSIIGGESIRNEIRSAPHDPSRVREVLNLDEDPDEIENVVIQYSDSDTGSDSDG